MTNRGLLKLAAKAAGIAGFWVDSGLNTQTNATPKIWNPLTDDGDALRLAVKLHLIVTFTGANGPHVSAGKRMGPFSDEVLPDKLFGLDDDCAATRRAVVRAAAEIGKGMK